MLFLIYVPYFFPVYLCFLHWHWHYWQVFNKYDEEFLLDHEGLCCCYCIMRSYCQPQSQLDHRVLGFTIDLKKGIGSRA